MAAQNLLKIIDHGVETWNEWRRKNPKISIELCRADLKKTDLTGANFSQADLRGADLSHAVLQGATLFDANLRDANLSFADLSRADLGGARLAGTRLHGTTIDEATKIDVKWRSICQIVNGNASILKRQDIDLRDTDLFGADFSGCDLRGIDFGYVCVKCWSFVAASIGAQRRSMRNNRLV